MRNGLASFVCRWHFLMQRHSDHLSEARASKYSLRTLYNTSHWFYLAFYLALKGMVSYNSSKGRFKSLDSSSGHTSITVERESLPLFLLESKWPKPREGSFLVCHQCLLVCCHGNCSWWWPLLSGSLMKGVGGFSHTLECRHHNNCRT